MHENGQQPPREADASAKRSTTLSKFAISRPVTTTMFFIAIVLLGCVSFHNLPVQLLPDIALPGAMIFARYRDLSVQDTLEKLTKPIEGIVASTPRVNEINSSTYRGSARMEIMFDFGTDMRFTTLDLQEKLTQFEKTLPRRTAGIWLRTFSTEHIQTFFMWIIVGGKDDRETLRQIAEDLLQPQLEAIDGVAEVNVGGYYRESIDVVLDRDKLASHRVGLGRVISRIRAAAAGETAFGRVRSDHENFSVVLGEIVEDEEDLRQMPLDDYGVIRLNDVAHVYRHQRVSDHVSRINGQNYVGLMIRKEATANPLRLAGKVERTLDEIRTQLPPGYTITVDESAAEIIKNIIRQVGLLAVIGALLAMVVLMLFVRNLRMALIVFTAIPISVITTFNLMYFGGLSLNIVTLIGLALGIGMLVDNAIVVLENIFRHYEHGRHATEASDQGTREVWRALLATTLTNVVVFTPVLFAEGELRLIFSEGAMAIIFPVTVSLLVALTLVPMVTSRILASSERRGQKRRRLARLTTRAREWIRRRHPYWPTYQRRPRRLYREFYLMILRSALRHRVRVLLLMLLAIYLTATICMPRIAKGRMKRSSEGTSFPIYVQVPSGSTRERLVHVLDEVEGRLQNLPELEKTRSFGDVEEGATVYVKLVPQKKRKRSLDEVRYDCLEFIGEVPGATLGLRPFEVEDRGDSGGGGYRNVSYAEGGVVEIRGSRWEGLEWVADGLTRQLETVPGISQVIPESLVGSPEMQFTIDRQRAAQFNIHAGDLVNYFETSQRRGQFSQITMERGDRRLDVLLRMGRVGHHPEEEEDGARPLGEIKSTEILSPTGVTVPLAEIGHFQKVLGEQRVRRHNLQYSTRVVYLYEPFANRMMIEQAVQSLVSELRLPPGYSAEIAGEAKDVEENNRQVSWMLMITALLVYMVMASVFESLLSPFVIMISLPLAAIGALWGLALSGSSFEELAMLGAIVLTGIVVNNGIVMMDFISMLRRERGYRRTAAIMLACRTRLRPILMTALTTILGLLPMALRTDEEIRWSGLAIVVICGLAASTVLTLVIVPTLLMALEDTLAFFRRQVARFWRWRWLFYFFSPSQMRAKRLELVPAGVPPSLAPTFATAMSRVVTPAVERDIETVAPPLETKAAPIIPPPEDRPVGIEVRHVRMTYPVFRLGKILNVVPSRRYKYGVRPPRGIEALRGVSLSIGKGTFGLVGPNGAGKTTLLHIIAGLIRPTCGFVAVNGLELATHRALVRAELGYLPQSFGLYDDLTARDYLNFYSLVLGIDRRAERRRNAEAVLDQVGLLDVADEQVGTLSGGMRQRLGIARLLLTLPRAIIVDEPTAGLDPVERVKFRVLLSQLGQERTVLLSTHIIDDISSSCRQLAVINEGRIVYDGTPAGLVDTARGRTWEYVGRAEDEATIHKHFQLIYKKAAGADRTLFRFLAPTCDLPGARPVEPSLEDAYVFATTTTKDK
ncbi:hypothetical protein AMJ85_08690 [candidate division BRC1 bacterium SM23_51]|nr:MAG: hypothetical protein AMJ85_08690 [candidate division BRC1 bacterium SM23_51]